MESLAPVAMRAWALFDPYRRAFLGQGGGLTTAAPDVRLFPYPAAAPLRAGMEVLPVDVQFDKQRRPAAVELYECEI